jgi:hypothetical protein
MKKPTIVSMILVFCMIAISAMAQEQTLITGDITSGGFGGPVLKVTEFDGDVGLMMGLRGGWVINRSLVIGAAGYGLNQDYYDPSDRDLNLGYGGGFVEYVILSDKLVHLSVNTLIGGGGVNYVSGRSRWYWDDDPDFDDFVDGFFVAEPGVDLVLNVTKFFRLGMGFSYRYVDGVELEGLSDSDISGPSANFTFNFGWRF